MRYIFKHVYVFCCLSHGDFSKLILVKEMY